MRGHVPANYVDQTGWNERTRLAVHQPVGVREEVLPAFPQHQRTGSAPSDLELYPVSISEQGRNLKGNTGCAEKGSLHRGTQREPRNDPAENPAY